MKRIKITEAQLKMLGAHEQKMLNENHLNSPDLNEEERSFLESYYEMEEGKKATIHHRAAVGTTRKVNHYDGTYDTGNVKEKLSLNDYFNLEGGDDGMKRLQVVQPELVDLYGDEYYLVDYERRNKGIRVKVRPKDYEKELEKANDPNGNFINYVDKEKLERIFDGSNIFIKI